MEELFEVTSCYFPIDFTPVSSTFHSFIHSFVQLAQRISTQGPILGVGSCLQEVHGQGQGQLS